MFAAIVILVIIAITTPGDGLIGFDCGGRHLNITTISLLGAGNCDLQIRTPTKTQAYVVLLQLSEYNYAEIIQCKIVIRRTVHYCGMHSHISAVKGGEAEFLEETSYDRCARMHDTGILNLGYGEDSIIRNLKKNHTETYSVTLGGTIGSDGKCKGISYQDHYGSWDDVIVLGTARVTLKNSYVPVKLNTGKILLKSGTVCELNNGFCIDSDDGYTFWKSTPTSSCDFHQYDVLYEGAADKMQENSTEQPQPTVYSISTDDIMFALTITKSRPVCGYNLQGTEHPKLFIVETSKDNAPKAKSDIPIDNLDIFAYVNSKFVYVEKHIRNQMTTLYHNVMQQRCELESEVLRNTLSFATLLPDEFAYRLMKGPGYMAVTAGEAIHIVKCIPVDATVRRTSQCYLELPVLVRNTSLFLTPKSRIITKVGTQKECSHELPTLYRIEDLWVQFLPEPHANPVPPQQLEPLTRMTWKYLTPGPLAESGIYSNTDISKLRDHIMFPAEKPALLNTVARGIHGYPMNQDRIPMQNLLDEEALDKIAQNTAARLWGGFVTFGSATAGVLGIFLIVRLIKIVIDTIIHGYALHTVYGCSLHLLGAVWSSLAHLLLHLARPPPATKDNNVRDANKTTTSTEEGAQPVTQQPAPAQTQRNRLNEPEAPPPPSPTGTYQEIQTTRPESSYTYAELYKKMLK